jgi:hypothetical protein
MVGVAVTCLVIIAAGCIFVYRRGLALGALPVSDVESNAPTTGGMSSLDITIGSLSRPSSSRSDWQIGSNIRSSSAPGMLA